jgi:hypothetical protein
MNPGAHLPLAVYHGRLYLPESMFSPAGWRTLERELTFQPKQLGDELKLPIALYDKTSRPGWFGVPRAWGLERFGKDVRLVDRTSKGSPLTSVTKRPDPNHPAVLNPLAQAKFMKDLNDAFAVQNDVQAIAATGSGKTVCALNTAAELNRTTLITVHLEHLAHQWRQEIIDKLGVDPSKIGWVQGDRCDYIGKDFIVSIIHSLAQKDYPQAFYDSIGFFIIDEAHKLGTEFFAPAVPKLNALKRLTLTATDIRKDGGHTVIEKHMGRIAVTSDAEALPGDVYVDEYDPGPTFRFWGSQPSARVSCLAKDPFRNRRLVKHIVNAFRKDRRFMIVSFAVDHLEVLMDLCERAGVPRDRMGLFTGEKTVMAPDPKNRRRLIPKRVKVKQAELDRIKAGVVKGDIRLFFTYGKFNEGGNIPELDSGMDATPRASATQVIGRVRRPLAGKKRPLWVTLLDVRCPMSKRWFEARRKDYLETGMEIVNDKGTRRA